MIGGEIVRRDTKNIVGYLSFEFTAASAGTLLLHVEDKNQSLNGSPLPFKVNADVTGGGLSLTFRRWATKKTAGSPKNGRDSKPKNLGVKKFGGE
ncbi:unnamed protein product [Camellia sinensis]